MAGRLAQGGPGAPGLPQRPAWVPGRTGPGKARGDAGARCHTEVPPGEQDRRGRPRRRGRRGGSSESTGSPTVRHRCPVHSTRHACAVDFVTAAVTTAQYPAAPEFSCTPAPRMPRSTSLRARASLRRSGPTSASSPPARTRSTISRCTWASSTSSSPCWNLPNCAVAARPSRTGSTARLKERQRASLSCLVHKVHWVLLAWTMHLPLTAVPLVSDVRLRRSAQRSARLT